MRNLLEHLTSFLIILGYFFLVGFLGFIIIYFQRTEFLEAYVALSLFVGIFTLAFVALVEDNL